MAGDEKPVTKGSEVKGTDGSTENDNPYDTQHVHADDPRVQAMQAAPVPGGLGMAAYAVATDAADAKQQKKIKQWAKQHGPSGSHGGGRMLRCSLGELKKFHKQVQLMAEAAWKDIGHARKVAQAEPTAPDVNGSVLFANQLGKWGNELQHTYKELDAYSRHLESVIKNYQNQEEDTKVEFKNFQGEL